MAAGRCLYCRATPACHAGVAAPQPHDAAYAQPAVAPGGSRLDQLLSAHLPARLLVRRLHAGAGGCPDRADGLSASRRDGRKPDERPSALGLAVGIGVVGFFVGILGNVLAQRYLDWGRSSPAPCTDTGAATTSLRRWGRRWVPACVSQPTGCSRIRRPTPASWCGSRWLPRSSG